MLPPFVWSAIVGLRALLLRRDARGGTLQPDQSSSAPVRPDSGHRLASSGSESTSRCQSRHRERSPEPATPLNALISKSPIRTTNDHRRLPWRRSASAVLAGRRSIEVAPRGPLTNSNDLIIDLYSRFTRGESHSTPSRSMLSTEGVFETSVELGFDPEAMRRGYRARRRTKILGRSRRGARGRRAGVEPLARLAQG